MADFECPYCGADQDVCYDDGHGCREDQRHEDECSECGKSFVFTTSIHFYHDARKADCLNGADHQLKPTATYPKRYTRMGCVDCDYERTPTDTEMAEILKDEPDGKGHGTDD